MLLRSSSINRVVFDSRLSAFRSFAAVPLAVQDFTDYNSANFSLTPLIIAHGLLGQAVNWRTIAKRKDLGGTRPVIGVDLRNHGSSPHHADMTYEAMVEDMVALIESGSVPALRNHKSVALLGHSLGGKVVMGVALTRPQLVKSLLVADMAPVNYPSFAEWRMIVYIVETLQSVDLSKFQTLNDADEGLKTFIQNKGLRAFLLKNLKRKDNGGFEWQINISAIAQNLQKFMGFPFACRPDGSKASFVGPTRFIAGADSRYLIPQYHREIEAFFPNSQVEYIPKAGHWVHVDQPEAVAKSIVSHLEKLRLN